ncbi:MAG: response regulator transcription factor [Pyrinomonadaceae bacterium]|nr:response regulator transcription factor [Pyrinomonadaceae bacterium]
MNKLRIMLAEDHATVREGLKMIIGAQADMEVVGEAADGRAAIERAKELLPDIIVMDVSMPELNGLKATVKLKQCCPQVKVLALTRHTDDGYLQQLLRAGASGYVLKQSAAAELIHAIRAVASGGKYLDPAVVGKVMGNYVGRSTALRGDTRGDLSDREAEVLRLIAWGHSNKELAARLEVSVKTVEAHKANAMKKLGISSRIDIVRYALLQGWLQDT